MDPKVVLLYGNFPEQAFQKSSILLFFFNMPKLDGEESFNVRSKINLEK